MRRRGGGRPELVAVPASFAAMSGGGRRSEAGRLAVAGRQRAPAGEPGARRRRKRPGGGGGEEGGAAASSCGISGRRRSIRAGRAPPGLRGPAAGTGGERGRRRAEVSAPGWLRRRGRVTWQALIGRSEVAVAADMSIDGGEDVRWRGRCPVARGDFQGLDCEISGGGGAHIYR